MTESSKRDIRRQIHANNGDYDRFKALSELLSDLSVDDCGFLLRRRPTHEQDATWSLLFFLVP